MKSPSWRAFCASFVLAIAGAGLSSCSSAPSSGADTSDLPTCTGATGSELKLDGDLDGAPFQVDQSPASGGYSQLGSGQFDTPFTITINGMPQPVRPGDTSLHLEWSQTIPDGSSAPASGTIVPPSGQPHAGETVCAGDGTRVVMPSGGDFIQFDLRGFAGGSGCNQPLSGRVRGCWSRGR